MSRRARLLHGLARHLVRMAATVVPASYRARFRDEWLAELWHLHESGASSSALARRARGVFEDAVATRRLLRERMEGSQRQGRHRMRGGLFASDVRLALRSFRERPLWTFLVLSTLCLGIGANTAIFSLVNAVLLRPLPYESPERLVMVRGFDRDRGRPGNLSPADFYDLAAESETFEAMGAHGWVGSFTVSGDGEAADAVRVGGSNVTAGFFRTLGVRPTLGRLFREEDDLPGASATVVLTYGFWRTRYGGDPDVVGQTILVDAEPHTVIGVLPPDFLHPEPSPERDPALYTLYQFDRTAALRSGRFLRAVGRLAKGRTLEEARSELVALADRLEREYPESNTSEGVYLLPLHESIVARSRTGLVVLYAAVCAVLLIVCANLAHLQLARGSARRRSLAIQAALGAGRARLVRQLLIESWLLAMGGGALGVVLARIASGALVSRVIPRSSEIVFDGTVLLFAFVVSTIVAVLFGLAPALGLSAANLRSALVEGGTRSASSRNPVRGALIGFEIALSVLLLSAFMLFGRSLLALAAVPPGFSTSRVLTASVSLPTARYAEGDQIPFYRDLEGRLSSIPGVASVGAINILPLTNNYSTDGFQIDDRPSLPGQNPAAEARSVTPGYFRAMGIPLLRGRLFDERDREDSPGVVIVSEAMAAAFWPGANPLGKHITYNRGLPDDIRREVGGPGSREVVGIVGNVKHLGLDEKDVPMFYTPHSQQPSYHTMTLVLRSSLEPEPLARAVTREVAALDPEVPVYSVRPLEEVFWGAMAAERFRTYLVGLFSLVALALACFGIYAVVGLAVVQREREIGIRLALGADGRDVTRMLVLESMRPVVWGLFVGALASYAMASFVRSLLFGIEPSSPGTYFLVTGLLFAAALLAALLPTQRAARLDPVRTLHAS